MRDFFIYLKTVDVKRRIKRRRFQLETTTIALKPVSNPKNAAKESKKIRKEVTPEDDDAFIRSEHVIENDLLNSDLVELKVDGDVELEPDENVLPIEAWADIRSFGENVDMAKNARLTCEMAIAMGSKDNVAVAAIRLPDVVEELEKNDSDNRNNIAGDEEKKTTRTLQMNYRAQKVRQAQTVSPLPSSAETTADFFQLTRNSARCSRTSFG